MKFNRRKFRRKYRNSNYYMEEMIIILHDAHNFDCGAFHLMQFKFFVVLLLVFRTQNRNTMYCRHNDSEFLIQFKLQNRSVNYPNPNENRHEIIEIENMYASHTDKDNVMILIGRYMSNRILLSIFP